MICRGIHSSLSQQPERVIRWMAPNMKDLDLKFKSIIEFSKKIQGIPEENLRKVEEFRQNLHFR